MDCSIVTSKEKTLEGLEHGDFFTLAGGGHVYMMIDQPDFITKQVLPNDACTVFSLTESKIDVLLKKVLVFPLTQTQQALFKRV